MADETENGALSQEALDELMNSVDTNTSEFSMEVDTQTSEETTVEAEVETEQASIADDLTSATPQAPFAAKHAPLHMESFDMKAASVGGSPLNGFERVNDIPLELTVELGRTKLLIKDVLELGTGSIIELEKMAGEPVDLLANGLLIARGEVVVIEDNFGIRVTEVITSADRAANADDALNLNVA